MSEKERPLTCDSCGVCCEEMGLPPGYVIPPLLEIPEPLRAEIAFHQEEERLTGLTRQERHLPCIWHDARTGRCLHYQYRPNACRKVQVGDGSCLFWRERRAWRLESGARSGSENFGTDPESPWSKDENKNALQKDGKESGMSFTPEQIKIRYERLKRETEAGGYFLNPDTEFTLELVDGLMVNELRYGYPSCPCRLAAGEKGEDLDIICPCDYRDPDLLEHNACYCALYVSKAAVEGEVKVTSIPERRPPREERLQFSPHQSGTAPSDLPYPVWRCRVCGYLCAREEPPEICPICKAKKERFERFM